jgi:hypothetical protein
MLITPHLIPHPSFVRSLYVVLPSFGIPLFRVNSNTELKPYGSNKIDPEHKTQNIIIKSKTLAEKTLNFSNWFSSFRKESSGVGLLISNELCYPRCRTFKCNKRSLTFRGKTAWCNETNDQCNPKGCTYAMCHKRQLLESGICGLTVKRKTSDRSRPEDMFQEEISVRGKLAKKTGERSIF